MTSEHAKQTAPMLVRPFPPRQITGNPYFYYGYVGSLPVDAKRATSHCCDQTHRGSTAAKTCSEQAALKQNAEIIDREAVRPAVEELRAVLSDVMDAFQADGTYLDTTNAYDRARALLEKYA